MSLIPKRLHTIWIGDRPIPAELVRTWSDLNWPEWEHWLWYSDRARVYRVWDGRGWADPTPTPALRPWKNQAVIDRCGEIVGKADAMRYEILHEHGGAFIDADGEALVALDDNFTRWEAWCCRQNETDCGPGLANGYLGARTGSPLMADLIAAVSVADTRRPAWEALGPVLLNKVAATHPELHVFPARTLIPQHYTGTPAPGTSRVYGKQHWGNTKGNYEKTGGRWPEHIEIPPEPPPVVDRTPRAAVSVIIPCFGAEQAGYLHEAVESVLAQTFKDYCIIIAAGGPHAEGRAESLKATHIGAPIRVLNGVIGGLADARNQGIEVARGRLILCLDADDKLLPEHLEKTVAAMGDTELGIVTTAMRSFGEDAGEWCLEDRWAGILEQNAVLTSSLYTRELWRRVGGYDPSMLGWEDWAYWIACSEYDPKVTYLKEHLFQYRVHGASMTKWDEKNDAGKFWRAMIHLRHPSLYAKARLDDDRRLLATMPPGILQRLRDRSDKFPQAHSLTAFLKMAGPGAAPAARDQLRGRWFDGRHET